jgi:DNA-directed RNA polymerase
VKEGTIVNNNTTLTIQLSDLIIRKYIALIREPNMSYSEFRESLLQDELKKYLFETNFKLILGTKLLELMLELDLLQLTKSTVNKQNISVLELPTELNDLLPKNMNNILVAPLHLPMIVKPKEYGPNVLGGYLLNDVEYSSELITKRMDQLGITCVDRSDNIVYDSINKMMNTAFKINTTLLYYLVDHNDKHHLLDITDSEKFSNIENPQNLKGSEKEAYQKYLSKKQLQDYVIYIAYTYRLAPEIFFPLRLDNRGRIYPIPVYLNYQSSELAKALLLFSSSREDPLWRSREGRGESIDRKDKIAINYLKAYGASCYGNGLNKKSYQDEVFDLSESIKIGIIY